MSELAVIALAVAATLGAWSAWAIPLWVGLPVVLGGLVGRQPLVLVAGVLALAAGLSARAWAGTAPAEPRPVDTVVTLVTDPVRVEGAVTAVVRLDGRRYEAWARAGAGRRLATRLAGERLQLIGQIRPVSGGPGRRLAERHVVGRLSVTGVGDSDPGDALARSANRVRRALVDGARSLPPAERALYTGFVLGDDRDEPPEVVDDFRASGLAHLTAVSGENVAFVLALAGPFLRRLGLGARAGTTVALLGWFALLTRFEPSVLRAVVMAGLATLAAAQGRDAGPLRLLALAVTALTLLDPLLVWSVSWWLSVGATLGIAVLARPLTARLPGPEGLRAAVAVTVAAQIGVAPVSGVIFGGIPLVSIPANLLAAPVAGPLMVWGLAGGAVAAFAPAPVAAVLHLPTQLGVRWIALVARLGARLPVGPLAPAACIALAAAAAAALAVLAWRARPAVRPGAASAPSRGRWVLAACGAVVVGALASALTPAPAPALVGVVLDGARVWSRGGQAVVVVQKADDGLLEALREAGVRQVAVLVATRPGAQLAHALEPVVRRYQPPLVLAPAGSGLAGARPPVGLEEHRAGGAALVFSAADDGIEVVEVPAPP